MRDLVKSNVIKPVINNIPELKKFASEYYDRHSKYFITHGLNKASLLRKIDSAYRGMSEICVTRGFSGRTMGSFVAFSGATDPFYIVQSAIIKNENK